MDVLTTIGLAVVMNRWVYVLAKKYNKPTISYTSISVLIFLLCGALFSQITTSIIVVMFEGSYVNEAQLYTGLLGLSGSIVVAIFYFILWYNWKNQQKKNSNDQVLDDSV